MPKTLQKFFVVILFCLSLFQACQEDWSEVEINGNCYDEYETIDFIEEQKAIIFSDNSEPVYLKIEFDKEQYQIIWPCNLPTAYQKEGIEVIFSAEIKALPTSEPIDTLENGTIQYITWDYAGIPVTLTSLRIRN